VPVVDTSALLDAPVGGDPAQGLIDGLADDGDRHVPHEVDIEILHALRRLTARGELSEDRALDARADFRNLALVRYPHVGLSDRIWELRQNLSAYDGP
jgi:predicted nucleic acid-binding protein